MQSWQSKLFERAIWLSGRRKKFLTEEAMEQFIELNRSRKAYALDAVWMKKHGITMFTNHKMDVYVLNPHAIESKTIVYFHGGAYINEPLSFHWRYLVKLAKKTGYKIFVPIYPKLPNFHYRDCYEQLDLFYDRVLTKQSSLIFMGDSAGGGLALGFAQKLQAEEKKGPVQNILFSPWLDLTGEGEGFEELEKLDPMVGVTGAKILAQLWHRDTSPKNHLVSPLYGNLEGIGETTIIVGTHELILLDTRRLKERAEQEGIPIHYYEFEKMNHVFPLFPIPEANLVWDIVLPKLVDGYQVEAPAIIQHSVQQASIA